MPKLSLNLVLKFSPDVMSNKLMEIEIGKIKCPNPIVSSLLLMSIQLNGRKYKLAK